MRAQHHRTPIHPGVIARRRTHSSASSPSSGQRRSRHKAEKRGQGARVIWLMMIIGSLVASGFLLAQRSQINAHQLRQAEEKFRTQLDDMTNQQRYLALEKERATNAQESDRIAKQAGLIQPQLKKGNQVVASQPSLAKSPVTTAPAEKAPVAAKQIVRSSVKPAVQPVTPAVKKAAGRASMQSAQATLAVKPVKILPTSKTGKDHMNQRQPAQKLVQKNVQKTVQKPAQKLAQLPTHGNREKRR